jgi:hypothetical protein
MVFCLSEWSFNVNVGYRSVSVTIFHESDGAQERSSELLACSNLQVGFCLNRKSRSHFQSTHDVS